MTSCSFEKKSIQQKKKIQTFFDKNLLNSRLFEKGLDFI